GGRPRRRHRDRRRRGPAPRAARRPHVTNPGAVVAVTTAASAPATQETGEHMMRLRWWRTRAPGSSGLGGVDAVDEPEDGLGEFLGGFHGGVVADAVELDGADPGGCGPWQ